MIETEAMENTLPEVRCKDCKNCKDVKNPVFSWCSFFKMDVVPDWKVRCSGYVPKN